MQTIVEFGRSIYVKCNTLVRFLISGGTAALTLFVLLYLFTEVIGIWYLFSSMLAFVGAFSVSFTLHKFWTFRDSALHRAPKQAILHLMVGLGNLVCNVTFLYVFVEYAHIHYLLAQFVSAGLLAVVSFFIYKHGIFHQGRAGATPEGSSEIRRTNDGMDSLMTYFKDVSDFVRFHLPAILLAISTGVIVILPVLFAVRALGPDYHGIPFLFNDDEIVYLTRIHEFADGYPEVASPFLHEYKDGVSVLPPTGEAVYWLMSKATGLSLSHVLVATKFLFPALLFLLIYTLVYLLLKGRIGARLSAIASAAGATLGYELANPFGAWDTFMSIWTRPVNPIIGGLSLFAFLIALYFILKKRYLAAIPAALLLAFMIGYIFSFGIALTSLALFAVIALMIQEYRVAVALTLTGVAAFLISLPHLVHGLSESFASGSGAALKAGLLMTHVPLLSKIGILAFVILSGFLWYKRREELSRLIPPAPLTFCFTVMAAVFIAMNQQIITGRTIWPHHFVQYLYPLCIMSLMVGVVVVLAPRFYRWWRIIPLSVIIVSFSFSLLIIPKYQNVLEEYRTMNRYAAALTWLSHMGTACVVFPIEKIEHLNPFITAFTGCDVYFNNYVYTGVPSERIMHNFHAYLAMQGIAPEDAEAFLMREPKHVWSIFFRDFRDRFRSSHDPWLLSMSDRDEIDGWVNDTTAEIVSRYREFSRNDLQSELKKYRIDYMIWDSEGGTPFDVREFLFLEKVFEQDGIAIYSMIP